MVTDPYGGKDTVGGIGASLHQGHVLFRFSEEGTLKRNEGWKEGTVTV